MPFSHLILCHPLLLQSPIPPRIRVFSNESTLRMRWPKYWSFSFSIIPSKEIPGLISFRKDWLDLLAVQGTLKSLLQHHSSKASIFRCSAFFTVQLLMVQWLRLCVPNAGGQDSSPGWGARFHMPQLRVQMPQLKILHAATKTWHRQISNKINILKILIIKNKTNPLTC